MLLTFISTMLLLLACCVIFFFASLLSTDYTTSESNLNDGDPAQKVAVIEIEGVISSVGVSDFFGNYYQDMTTLTISKLDQAQNSDNVKAVILAVDSPGGEVYASKLIYNKIIELMETGKPVVVLMKSQAASGGYYISAPADWIVASEMTLTGSIGVKFSTIDTSGLYEKIGVKQIEITNSDGNYKVLTELDNPDSEDYKLLQGVVDDYHTNFVNVVVAGRELTEPEVRLLADGRVYSGQQALGNGLIDQLGEMDVAMDKAAALAELDDPQYVLLEDDLSGYGGYGLTLLYMLKPEASILAEIQSGTATGIKAYYLLDF